MKRMLLVAAATVFCGSLLAVFSPHIVESQDKDSKIERSANKIEGRYIVILEEWAAGALGDESNASAVAEELSIVYQGRVDKVFKHAVNGFSIELNDKQAELLSRDARVKHIEEDSIVSINATQTNAPWGLDRIDQRDRPLNSTYIYTPTGSGVNSYIIDTGIRRTHSDFGLSLCWYEPRRCKFE